MTMRAYQPHGELLALNPRAFGMMLMQPPEPKPQTSRDVGNGVHVVDVRGPLEHHATDCYLDNYDAIAARVQCALDAGARTVILAVDSPGGLVSGCFDTARRIREACDAKGATLLASVEGQSCSAAYALTCAAHKVYTSESATVGSVGVLTGLVDETTRDAAMGLRFVLIGSGAHKTDGQPHAAVTDAAVLAAQTHVDSLAAQFFAHVASYRALTAAAVAGFQAAVFTGAQAVGLGLADAVMAPAQVLLLARAGGESTATKVAQTEQSTMNEEQEKAARAGYQAVLDDEKADAKAKARAKAILAAMDGDGEEPKKEEAKAEEPPTAPPKDEPDGDEAAKAKAAAGDTAALAAKALAGVERIERAQILATRPDLTDAQRTAFAGVPTSALAAALGALPRNTGKPAATAVVAATRGSSQGAMATPDDEMDLAMGLAKTTGGIRRDGARQLLGVMTPAEAKAYVAAKAVHGGAQ